MARNNNAGKFTGKSKSSKFYAKNPKARAKKNALNKKLNATPSAIKKRGEENKARVDLGLSKGDGMDASAKVVNGKTVYVAESSSKNRGKTGDAAGASKGDKNSRPGKSIYAKMKKKKK